MADTLDKLIKEELEPLHFDNCYCESHEAERGDFVSTFGGLFFLGILFSIIFLISCVIIMYYKQVSEGFEDQSRFDIMQKVGMTKKKAIKKFKTAFGTKKVKTVKPSEIYEGYRGKNTKSVLLVQYGDVRAVMVSINKSGKVCRICFKCS